MQRFNDEHGLLAALVDGAFEAPLWSSFLDRLLRVTGAEYTSLTFRRSDPALQKAVHLYSGEPFPPAVQRRFEEVFNGDDPLPYHTLDEGRVYALYNIDGVVSAIDGICPHQGGPLADGQVDGTMVTCPWHGWQFDIRSGKTPLGPKIKQPVYEVKLEGRDILVSVD